MDRSVKLFEGISMAVCLPGDFVSKFADDQRPFLSDQNEYFSSTVLGIVSDDQLQIAKTAIVPKVHDEVIVRVIRVRRKEAHLVLLTANGRPLGAPLLAELRSVDVQAQDVDNVIVPNFCRPGNLVRARVVALGRSGFYAQLSTAEPGMEVLQLVKN
jgi:exosome complex component CSL4